MAPALPLIHDEVFLDERRRIRQRLRRLRKFASAESGFPSALGSLVACADEIEGLLPVLSEHYAHAERIYFSAWDPDDERGEWRRRGEEILAEHQPLIRELRALQDSARRVIDELRAGQSAGSLAEALKAYLSACVQDLVEHETRESALFES